jgi:hypothetical protein
MSNAIIDGEKRRLYIKLLLPGVNAIIKNKIRLYNPITGKSVNWKVWKAFIRNTTCDTCKSLNGKIFSVAEIIDLPKIHPNCACKIVLLDTVKNGTATIYGNEGADFYLYRYGFLPEQYVKKEEAERLGWIPKEGNLHKIDKFIGGNIYFDRKHKLPYSDTRIWYEADINYINRYRNKSRIIYSNDGLIFVTYDHYETFFEIV